MNSKNNINDTKEIKIELVKANNQEKKVLKSLNQFYLHDLSEFAETLDSNPDGIFEDNKIDVFYEEENNIPLAIKYNDRIIGFLLLRTSHAAPKDFDYFINDIFILKKFRRKGIGRIVIGKLLEKYRGRFSLLELVKNSNAIDFWNKVIKENNFKSCENRLTVDNEECIFQGFEISQ